MEYYNMDNIDDIINKASPGLIGRFKLEPILISKLRAAGIMTESLDNELKPIHLTPNDKNQMVLDDLKVGPIERFLHFCRIMHETGQTHVITALDVKMDKIYSQLGIPQPPVHAQPASTESLEKAVPQLTPQDNSIHLLWTKEHPNGKTSLENNKDLYRKIIKALPNLKKSMRVKNLFAHLQSHQVIDGLDLDDVKAGKTNGDQVENLIEFLKPKPVWRTHAFFRSLAETDQPGVIETVLGEGQDKPYLVDPDE